MKEKQGSHIHYFEGGRRHQYLLFVAILFMGRAPSYELAEDEYKSGTEGFHR